MAAVNFPVSVLVVLHELATKGPMTPKQLRSEVKLSPRSVSSALKRLIDDSICRRIPNLRDMRQPLYCANPERIRELQINFEKNRAMMKIFMKIV